MVRGGAGGEGNGGEGRGGEGAGLDVAVGVEARGDLAAEEVSGVEGGWTGGC